MPICTSCSHPTTYLYTVYNSPNNLRLEECSACHAFADPYVEHDTLTLVLDLILLKRNVYRHLLFNRGSGVRRLDNLIGTGSTAESSQKAKGTRNQEVEVHKSDETASEKARIQARWLHIVKLGAFLIVVDAFVRWTHIGASQPVDFSRVDVAAWNLEAISAFVRIFIGCLIETVAFHVGITSACYVLLKTLDRVYDKHHEDGHIPVVSGVRQEFRLSHVPLTLLYSSFTKLFLLFLLSIWRPHDLSTEHSQPLPHQYNSTNIISNPMILGALDLLNEDKLDREWVVRNVLGGMAAGFGLRVVLDCHPAFTTLVVLVGWAVKTAVANLVSEWVMGGTRDRISGEMWLAYSIP